MITLTINLPDELLERVKQRARADGTTVDQLIEHWLSQECAQAAMTGQQAGPSLDYSSHWFPVSTRSGGVRTGIDLTKTSSLLVLDDEESYGAGA